VIEPIVRLVEAGRHLSMEQMAETIGLIMEGRCGETEIARLLSALHRKGETVAEVAGAAAAMRRQMTPIRTSRTDVIDVVGTGGDGSGTFNISTAAALVTAAAGVPVAKHGNRGFTSRSGSADVLAVLGVNIEANVAQVEACLDELGVCFCFAPLLHQAMRHVAPVRKKLPHPTIFNILGPLANPAGAPLELLGVGRAELRPLLAEALAMLGTRRTLVVHGADGLDEVTLADTTHVTEAAGGRLRQFDWTPADFGLQPAGRETMMVDGPEQSAALIREIFDGRSGPPRDIVVANAAAALWTAGRDNALPGCSRLAAEAIDSGAARELLARLAERTNA
jgi:anthranilate phosphoribosyltransferase